MTEKKQPLVSIPETKLEFHESHHARIGAVLGVLILILVLILGGLFLWGSMLAEKEDALPAIENNEPETPRAEADAQILETVSTSDELDAINADLESTNLDSIDSDLQAIDNEFAASGSAEVQ